MRRRMLLTGPQVLRRWRGRVTSLAIVGWMAVAVSFFGFFELPRFLPRPTLVLIALVLSLPTLVLTVWIRARRASGWIGTVSRQEMRRILAVNRSRAVRIWFLEQYRLVASPSWSALVAATVVITVGVVGLLLLSLNTPPPPPNTPAATPTDTFLTLWQVQTALGGIALPILVFVIELAKDDETLARGTAEVLIRYTWIFPVISFVLMSSLVFGIGGYWFVSSAAYPLLFAFHVVTIVLAVFAYWRALRLLFDKELLRGESVRLLRERFESSIDETVRRRLGANILLQKAEQLGIKFSPIEPDSRDKQYVVLRTQTAGLIDDVNLWHLEEFLRQLPWKRRPTVSLDSSQEPISSSGATQRQSTTQPQPSVQILKLYGGRVYEGERGLLALTAADFEPLDRAVLEARLKEVFRIVRENEG